MVPQASTAGTPGTPAGGANLGIDVLRLLAAYFVVQVHAHAPGGFLNVAAVGFFAMSMTWFLLVGLERPKAGFGRMLSRRLRRLLVPFALWGAVQVAAKTADALVSGQDIGADLAGWFPPQGHFAQLWYLPWAAMVCALLMALFWRRAIRLDGAWPLAVLVWAAVLAFSALCIALREWVDWPPLAELFVFYLPSVAIGALLFALRDSRKAMLLAAGAFCAAGLPAWAAGFIGAQQLVLTAPLMVLALQMPWPAGRLGRHLAPLAFDIYLVHTLVLPVVARGLGLATDTWIGGLGVFVLSAAVAAALQMPDLLRGRKREAT